MVIEDISLLNDVLTRRVVTFYLPATVLLFAAGFYLDFGVAKFFFSITKSCDDPSRVAWFYYFEGLSKVAEPQFFIVIALSWWFLGAVRDCSKQYFEGRFAFFCFVMAAVLVPFVKMIFVRSRPILYACDQVHGFYFFEGISKFSHRYASFPSGHAVNCFAMCAIVTILHPGYRFYALVLAVLCSFSRIVVSAHFLTDVIAGALLGYCFVLVCYRLKFRDQHGYVAQQFGIAHHSDGESLDL